MSGTSNGRAVDGGSHAGGRAMSTRYFFFWCPICPTRIRVETDVDPAADFPDPHYHFAFSEGVAAVRVKPATEHDDGLETADLCPACNNPLDDLDELLARRLVPYHDAKDTPAVHAAWLAKVRAGEKW